MKIILFAFVLVCLPALFCSIKVALRQNAVSYIGPGVGIPLTQAYGSGLGRSVAVDHRRRLVYTAGGQYITVSLINKAGRTRIVHASRFPNYIFNSIQICNGMPSVTAQSTSNTTNGRLLIFRPFRKSFGGSLQIVRNITVGIHPVHHVVTKSCHKVLVAVTGNSTNVTAGSVIAIYFPSHKFLGGYVIRNLTLSHFGLGAVTSNQYLFVTQAVNFTMGIVPYYIAFNPKQTIAYVSLRNNNGLAKINMRTGRIMGIRGLGLIDYQRRGYGFDSTYYPRRPSIVPHPVLSLYSPGQIALTTIKGRDIIFVTSMGFFNPMLFVQLRNASLDPTRFPNAAALQMDSNLGLLYVLRSGLADPDRDGDIDRLFIVGGRSIAAFDAKTLRRFADTGCTIERTVAKRFPFIFNANPSGNSSLQLSVDLQSVLLGPRIGAIKSVTICKGRYELVVGAGMNPGFLVAYTMDRLFPSRGFTFQSVVQGYTLLVGNNTDAQLLAMGQLHLRRPTSLAFYHCGFNQLMLFAGATLSGTLTSYRLVYSCPKNNNG